MTLFLDTEGQTTLGIGLCDRCKRKFPLAELLRDPNSPGLRVCVEDRDQFDPWRLPARQSERINLPFVRPDEPMDGVTEDYGIALFSEIFVYETGGYHMIYENGAMMETENGQ